MLALTMITAFMPIIASADTNGACGENLTWELDAAGTLTVSGNGAMTDYALWSDSPFVGNSNIKSIIIEDGVTSIGKNAFSRCEELTSVSIPPSVVRIGTNAFSGCSKWDNISLPDTVKIIEVYAFGGTAYYNDDSNWDDNTSLYIDNCLIAIKPAARYDHDYVVREGTKTIAGSVFSDKSLTSISLPESLVSIGPTVFWYCDLKNITIPKNVSFISPDAFMECGLENITVSAENPNFSSVNGQLFNKDQTAFLCYAGNESETTYTVPDGVIKIGDYAFRRHNLEKVTLPDSVEEIGEYAFYNCINLKDITIPKNVTSIGKYAFYSCYGVPAFDLPSGLTHIGDRAFQHCYGITSIEIPDGVESIKERTFQHCYNIKSMTIPDSVKSIESMALDISNAMGLPDIYYKGTRSQWEDISINNDNHLENTTIHFNYFPTTPDAYSISKIKPTNTGIALTINPTEVVDGEQTAIIACYDEKGVFTGMQQKQVKSSDGEQTLTFDIDKTKVSNVKAFIWNDLNYMMPASETKTLDLNNSENQEVNVTFTQNEDGTIELTWDNTEYPNYYFKIVDSDGNKVVTGWNTQGFSKTGDIATYLPRVDTHSTFSFVLSSGTEDFNIGEEIARVENCFDISVDGDPLEYDIAFNTPEKNNHTVTLKSTIPAGIRHISAFYRNDKICSSGSGYSSGDMLPGHTLTEVTELQDGDVFDLRMLTSYKLEGQVLKATMTPASTTTYKAVTE